MDYKINNYVHFHECFYMSADTDCCVRQCCGPVRPFDLRVLDNQQREVSVWCTCTHVLTE